MTGRNCKMWSFIICTPLTKYYNGDQFKKAMGEACSGQQGNKRDEQNFDL